MLPNKGLTNDFRILSPPHSEKKIIFGVTPCPKIYLIMAWFRGRPKSIGIEQGGAQPKAARLLFACVTKILHPFICEQNSPT